MPPERYSPDDPREWLEFAKSDLAHAKQRAPGVRLETCCFSAQQAAEKAVKALLLHRKAVFPYIHDLGELLALLEQTGELLPPPIKEARRLTRFAFEARYPGPADPVTPEEYRQAVAIAEKVVRWAESVIEGREGEQGRK